MIALIIALFSGTVLAFAFAPLSIYTFAFIAPAVLFYLWLNATPRKAALQGFFFGLGFFSVGVSWVFISVNTYGNTPLPISILITALLIIYLALFPAIQGYLIIKLFKNKSDSKKCLCLFPASWVLWEWLRSIIFTGFPWLFLGYTQMNTPLRGYAPLFGVYGITLAVTWIAGCLALLARRNSNILKSACVVIIFSLVGIGWLFSNHAWTKPAGPAIKISLIQGNIAQPVKWQREELIHILQTYLSLTEKNWAPLVVWPEAAVPIVPQQIPGFLQNINSLAINNKSYLLFGAPLLNEKTHEYYNGLLLSGAGNGQYIKRHLVPFGEYFPLKWAFSWFTQYFKIPMSDFTAGPKKQAPITVDHFQIAPFICYEIAYPSLVLESVKNKNLIVTITDDSWFGQSMALAQHLQMAQMRALETGRYLLLAANTGITAVVDPYGKIIAMAPINQPYVVNSQITPMQNNTPLMRWYYYPIAIIILILLVV